MTRAWVVLILGLGAALAFAVSAFLQQNASRRLDGAPGAALANKGLPGAVRLFRRLVRSPRWFAGWLVNLGGFGLQAAALRLGSVAAVQPLMTTQLLFAMPLASWEQKRRPTWPDLLAGAAICAGIALFMTVDGAAPLTGAADRGRVLLAVAAGAAGIGLLVSVSRGRPPTVAAVLLACAAGICFALSAVFMKLTADSLLDHGVRATAVDWVGYALAGSTGLGLVLGQTAYAAGPLPWALAAMNIVNPVASYLAGALAFDASVPSTPGALAGVVGAGALLVIGVVGLVRSPSARVWNAQADHA
ncbi:MAG: DMT family transporter [Nocardioides sp.]|uniref:DMT family transporter n=1 Tax=Nocardioides sp. TaxID=35761 RepID=UPI0039E639FF